ncbi:hypothetical protein BKA70DRAFT_1572899 [Coprinopsis sp. MPI-PUGE-AT-0042]|nr:hypothetical protein BKA70DRAFT_1572899 [Coprinopsis sp. MPI-PUGE-AT-0042]
MPIQDRKTLDDTYGAALIGVVLNAVLYGATSSQTYNYYHNYPKDSRFNKLIVGTLWIIDTVHTCFASQAMYYYLISNYANPFVLEKAYWTILVSVLLNRIISFIAQSYFTHILFKLCARRFRWWIAGIIGSLVVAHLALGTTFVALCFAWGSDYARVPEMNKYAATPAVIAGVVAEFMIATCLCILLKGRETRFKGTRKIISLLIFYAINRCLLSSAFLTLEAVLMETKSETFYYMAIDFIVGKLFVASILATLNARPLDLASSNVNVPSMPSNRGTVYAVEYGSRRNGTIETHLYQSSTPGEREEYALKEVPFPFSPLRRPPSIVNGDKRPLP